jgi:outer membrane protein
MRYHTKKKGLSMMKSALLAMCLVSANASAAMILGFGVEADYLAPAASGSLTHNGTKTEFGSSTENGYQLGAYLEHPIPLVPNIRLDYTSELEFNGVTAGAANSVAMTQLDITPYYEILDNVVDLDVGITAKTLRVKTTSAAVPAFNDSYSTVIPMGYIGAAVMLPGLPLSFAGSVKYIGYEGDSLTDARIKAMWDIALGVSAQVGYRYESLKLDDTFDTTSDAEFKGVFAGLAFTF